MVGTHYIVDLTGVENAFTLSELRLGRLTLERIIDACGLHVVGEAGHQFSPAGYTQIYLLSESHFSIHTYPETASCHIDIYCCDPTFNVGVARRAIRTLFRPGRMEEQVIHRGDPTALSESE